METKRIGTHSGAFHCDEALACFMLRLHPQFRDFEIVRTRDPKVLASLPIVVDVGGVYDFPNGRLDHHQRGFTETLSSAHSIKLSSAGLVYKHYGVEIIANLTGLSVEDPAVSIIFQKVYKDLIESVDAIDNGINQFPEHEIPKYQILTDLSSRVGYLNPSWNETVTEEEVMKRFHKAMEITGEDFVRCVSWTHKSFLPARALVKDAIVRRHQFAPSGEIVLLENAVAWKSHLFSLETELKIDPILFMVYADSGGSWRVQCVPSNDRSFQSRLPLLENWRGLRDAELSAVAAIDGCIFVHASGFIGGHATREGALAMALATIAARNKRVFSE